MIKAEQWKTGVEIFIVESTGNNRESRNDLHSIWRFLYGKIYITERFIPWKGSTRSPETFKGKKAIICVGGGSMKRFGFLQKAEDY